MQGRVQDMQTPDEQALDSSTDMETIDIRADKGVQKNSEYVSDDDVVNIHVKYCIG